MFATIYKPKTIYYFDSIENFYIKYDEDLSNVVVYPSDRKDRRIMYYVSKLYDYLISKEEKA